MASLYVPLTGLESSSEALSVTSNNLANLNTVGFKTQRPLFADLFYQQIGTSGDGDPKQLGVGATVQAVDSEFTQ
ncbi:MAG TPA: flagellar basal body protein, partial [Candidatus Acidoferrum sp.]|nr:flagellar basal body protein [Candidatus Acidoferrum sp.]